MSLIYLASPYTHPKPAVCELRFLAVCQKAAQLMLEGDVVFSPVAHSHPIARQMPDADCMALDPLLWQKQDAPYVEFCTELFVLALPGWERSGGVRAEIERFGKRGIAPQFVNLPHYPGCDPVDGCDPKCVMGRLLVLT